MVRQGVRVAIRTRPTAQFAHGFLEINTSARTIGVRHPSEGDGVVSNKQDSWNFKFHSVLHNASQDTVYDTLCDKIVRGVIEGRNGTIMAYGQTGAGKTFTMIGDTRHYKHRGIAPRAVAQLFQEMSARPEMSYKVRCTYMEIYNDSIFDLLATDDAFDKTDFAIVEDRTGGRGTMVKGLTEVPIESEEEALNLMFQGEVRRTTAEHLLNKNSNRSHCIFSLHVTQRSRLGSSEKITRSKLHLVDLAGSERLKKTMADNEDIGKTVSEGLKRESMYINKSLTYLEQCVVALTDKNRSHVPYRQTKLTNVLKDSLGGNCNTLMIACIWGEAKHLEETTSTLKLASRMMHVKNETLSNVILDPEKLVRKYEKEIKTLKQELMMHDALADRSGVVYEEYTPEQQQEVAKELRTYLFCKPEEEEKSAVELESVRKMMEILRQAKIIVRNIANETEERLRTEYTLSSKGGARGSSAAGGGASGDGKAGEAAPGSSEMVGDVDEDESAGFGLGTAPAGARPQTTTTARPGAYAAPSPGGAGGGAGAGVGSGAAGGGMGGSGRGVSFGDGMGGLDAEFTDRESAYKMWSADQGASLASEVAEQQAETRKLRAAAKAVLKDVNATKARIDSLSRALDEKRSDSSATAAAASEAAGGDIIVDEEEFRMMKELSTVKKEYRAHYADFRTAKGDVAEANSRLEALKAEALESFEEWFAAVSGVVPDATPAQELKEDEGDILDDGEAFDKLEMERVANDDPDSLAYFNAQKRMRGTHTTRSRRRG